ncbi:ABC transporter permease [Sphingomonas elodea]|uniref:ABC transporter permease n=1 Tax=Sphingomonas elodea TaxID=179878 RepID=UPI0002630D11|nr:ABC transporter permease [Sphingomonas elodea]
MTLLRTLATRLASGVLVLWIVATLTFGAMHATAGDPAIAILGGPDALPTQAVVEEVRREYGLNDPLPVQYARYLGRLLSGDLGESYRLRTPVTSAILEQLGSTVVLGGIAGVLALAIALGLALVGAGRGPRVGGAITAVEVVITAVPNFVIGVGLMFLLAFQLRLVPVAGEQGWASLVLPVLTLAIPSSIVMAQVLRSELDEVLEQPFILTARARGLGEAGVRVLHALRHAVIPLLTLAGYVFGFLLGGTVITETLFARRGIGRLMVDSALTSDIPMVIGISLFIALSYVLVTLIVDLIAAAVDPRARLA